MVYVGATNDLRVRMNAHSSASWWLEVDQSSIEVAEFEGVRWAGEAERRLIAEHQPRHNRAGVVGPYIPYRPSTRRSGRGAGSAERRAVLIAQLRGIAERHAGRPALIEEARREGRTWQEIADALHMTAHGARKLHKTLPASERQK